MTYEYSLLRVIIVIIKFKYTLLETLSGDLGCLFVGTLVDF
jgi:hypothetical protein